MIQISSVGKIELVIFDCERITNTVLAQMLDELGISMTLEQMFDRWVGNSISRSGRHTPEAIENSIATME